MGGPTMHVHTVYRDLTNDYGRAFTVKRHENRMNTRLAVLAVVFPWSATPAFSHPLDEYLQATLVAVTSDRLVLHLRLTPGVSVAPKILAIIDADGDGDMSDAEQRAYAELVHHDLAVNLDGAPLSLRLTSSVFSTAEEFTKGVGDVQLEFAANLPSGGPARRLTLENRHQSAVAVYLVNCLVPRDPRVRIVAQDRNYTQSRYQLDFALGEAAQDPEPAASPSGTQPRPDLAHGPSVVKTYFFHGVRHILTGFDHLLFLSALVLAARTFWELVKVVTAFTIAHSVTLTLAALDVVHLPEAVVEPVIAASIVVVAAQNILWPGLSRGRGRLAAAFVFGLFHGLGFAGGLLDVMHAMPEGTALQAILGFSVGVEAGHLLVLAPLFGLVTAARRSQHDAVKGMQLVLACQRIGSAGILMAGMYYLCIALAGS